MNNILLKVLNLQAASKKNKPKEVFENLEIKKGDVVADIGSGGGFYTYKFASTVGNNGKVYAVDVDQRYLSYIERNAQAKKLSNIIPILTTGSELILPPQSVDVIFMRDVFHDINNPSRYFQNIYKALKPNGKVAIIDFINNSLGKESLSGHCSDEKVIIRTMEDCGFTHHKQFNIFAHQSFNIFKLMGEQ